MCVCGVIKFGSTPSDCWVKPALKADTFPMLLLGKAAEKYSLFFFLFALPVGSKNNFKMLHIDGSSPQQEDKKLAMPEKCKN